MQKVILASASPRRAGLMEIIGLDFIQRASGNDEEWTGEDASVQEIAVRLAMDKASMVAAEYLEPALVIGADTMVVLDGAIIGKPVSQGDAWQILKALSGREHQVITGLCIFNTADGRSHTGCEQTRVWFRDLQDYEIDSYIKSGECDDKAGAYGIQGRGALLVESIEGCYYNVVGLPLNLLRKLLLEAGLDIWRATIE